MLRRRIQKTFVILACFIFLTKLVFGYEDGFGAAKKTESKHFVIYYDPQIDPNELLQKLNIGSEDALLSNEPVGKGDALAVALDTLYGRIGGILDMNLYSLQGNLKICRDSEHIKDVYSAIFGNDLKADAFYVNDLDLLETLRINYRLIQIIL